MVICINKIIAIKTGDNQMKKIISTLLVAATAATMLAGCGSGSSASDWSYIQEKGEMVIGITYFEPMNYKDENGELTGFETEFAQAVCEKMGVEATFQKIDWESKEVELNSKTIDCIWNGLTITDERKENMDISVAYMENKQVMVTKAENADKYTSADALKGATVVAEKKSAGEDVAKEDEFFAQATYVSVDSQAKALLEVKSGTADVAIIDYVMSIGTITNGTDYADLQVVEGQSFAEEQYGIAIRKDSPETLQKINDAIQELANEGELEKIATKYELQDLILVQPE